MNAVNRRTILVTSALPYANGAPHLGHIVEYVQTDIWVRFQRLRGHDCLYVCASDAHGTPIMLKARQEGISPEALIERVGAEQRRDFADFDVSFDNFHTTHSPENRELTEGIYERLVAGGHIRRETIRQAYDEQAQMFLPDRYVRGTCPRCGALDQYGDSCESCGATYTPADLVNAISVVSGTPPVQRDSEHLFFRLGDFEPMLREWTGSGRLQPAVTAKLDEWFTAGLRDWDISRDAPYFGFEIPGETGKYFYVWLDAPIGYIGSFLQYCRRTGLDFDRYWKAGSDAEVYHFIGKDIVYFHTLFWPAVLHGCGLPAADGRLRARLPDRERAEDVEVARHVHHGTRLARSPARGIPAVFLRVAARPRRRRHRPEPRRVRRQDQFRPGRQARQHREPLRRVHRARLAGPARRAAARAGLVRRIRRRGGADRRGVRGTRPRLRGPRGHAARRPGQPVHRPAEAVADGQGSRARRRRAGRLHPGPEPVQGPRAVPEADRAATRRGCRALPRAAGPALAGRHRAAAGADDRHLRAARDAGGSRRDQGAAGGLCREPEADGRPDGRGTSGGCNAGRCPSGDCRERGIGAAGVDRRLCANRPARSRES